MVDFVKARVAMVDSQIRTIDVTEYDVLDAFSAVQREHFVPEGLKPLSYIDEDLLVSAPGAPARYMMEAGPLARLVQLADIATTDKILDVGCTTGYSSAILAMLGQTVTALEEDPALAERAKALLASAGVTNVDVVSGPLVAGWAAAAPFDVILIEGAVDLIPDALTSQLAENGRIVAVFGDNGLAAKAMIYTKTGGSVSGRPVFNTHVRPLVGFAKPKSFVF